MSETAIWPVSPHVHIESGEEGEIQGGRQCEERFQNVRQEVLVDKGQLCIINTLFYRHHQPVFLRNLLSAVYSKASFKCIAARRKVMITLGYLLFGFFLRSNSAIF